MKGKVYLVGAGPGDMDLITVKGRSLLEIADVLVYDRLANPSFLDLLKPECQRIYVGKQSSNHTMKQEDIEALLVDLAKDYEVIVRLKGGDPYVFGRGGEEGLALEQAGVSFEVIPGISSAIGGLAYAGIPITHRDLATSFHVITGHLKDDEADHDWQALSQLKGTLVFLMGMSNLGKITNQLMTKGKSPETPVAIVHWASHPMQKVITGTLSNIEDRVLESGIGAPSLIVIGDVVKMRDHLNFFEQKPLIGKRCLVTRASHQAGILSTKLRQRGCCVIEKPMIEIEPLQLNPDALNLLRNLPSYDYVVLTSLNGVDLLMQAMAACQQDARHFFGTKIVAIGGPTSARLADYGLKADLVPDRAVAEGLIELLIPMLIKSNKVLLPGAINGRPLLRETLSQYCQVDHLPLYRTGGTSEVIEDELLKSLDYITFTSASTVHGFMKSNRITDQTQVISIGPITSEALRSYEVTDILEAKESTVEGIVQRMIEEVMACD